MKRHVPFLAGLLLAVTPAIVTSAAAAEKKTVKVFILAGQSNMEGKAKNELLDHQAQAPKTKELFAHLRKDVDGFWFINFNGQRLAFQSTMVPLRRNSHANLW